MKITNLLKAIAVSFTIVLAMPVTSNAMHNSSNISTPLSDSAADVKVAAHIIQRVTEIQNMDKTNLTTTEKKALKKELREMKSQADGLNKGVYLSIGAIIIIILLLILIL